MYRSLLDGAANFGLRIATESLRSTYYTDDVRNSLFRLPAGGQDCNGAGFSLQAHAAIGGGLEQRNGTADARIHFSSIGAQLVTTLEPGTPEELYLDLLKRILTRALVARQVERHTARPAGVKRLLFNSANRLFLKMGAELVRLRPSRLDDYHESGYETYFRCEGAETMIGTRQLDNLQFCIRSVLDDGIPGDLLEAGVWRGGTTIFMRAALKAYQVTDRKVWAVDSFAGLPPLDRSTETYAWHTGDMASSLEEVRENFARYGLLDNQVEFLKGYFCDTLPGPIGKLSILRADGDLYSSTTEVMTALYPKLSSGGYAIFDDYHNLRDCRRAIHDYREAHDIGEEIQTIDEKAVFWRKR